MSLSDVAAIGSLVSGMAVLASLVYLSLQIRQNTKHSRALIGHGRATRVVESNYHLTDPVLSALVTKGRKGEEELSEVELNSFMAFSRATFWNAEDTFVQYREGLLGAASFDSFSRAHVNFMQASGSRAAWKLLRWNFGSDFVAFMDRIAQQGAERGPADYSEAWSAALAAERAASATG